MNLSQTQARMLAAMHDLAPLDDKKLEQVLWSAGVQLSSESTYRSRRAELVRFKLVRPMGFVTPGPYAKRRVQTWQITELGREVVRRLRGIEPDPMTKESQ